MKTRNAQSLAAIVGLFVASTALFAAPGAAVVEFSASRSRDQLHLECSPNASVAPTPDAWVDACGELARQALDKAAREGTVAPVQGEPFGQAAGFIKGLGKTLQGQASRLVRDSPLLHAR